jgi:D-alanyl-D-alanine dipeptidase
LKITRRSLAVLILLAISNAPLHAQQQQQGPPKEAGQFRQPDILEIVKLDSTIRLDIRYATGNNFTGRPVCKEARAFLQRLAAEALVRVNSALMKQGYGNGRPTETGRHT